MMTPEQILLLAENNPAKLMQVMKNMVDEDLTFAAEYLGSRCNSEEAKDCLIKLTKHKNALVREGVVYGLSHYDDERVGETLKGLSNDPSPGVREAVEDALEMFF